MCPAHCRTSSEGGARPRRDTHMQLRALHPKRCRLSASPSLSRPTVEAAVASPDALRPPTSSLRPHRRSTYQSAAAPAPRRRSPPHKAVVECQPPGRPRSKTQKPAMPTTTTPAMQGVHVARPPPKKERKHGYTPGRAHGKARTQPRTARRCCRRRRRPQGHAPWRHDKSRGQAVAALGVGALPMAGLPLWEGRLGTPLNATPAVVASQTVGNERGGGGR